MYTDEEVHFSQTVAHVFAEAIARRRAKRDVQDVEERLRLTREASVVGSWDWDLTTDQVTGSDQLFRIYGLLPSNRRRWSTLQ